MLLQNFIAGVFLVKAATCAIPLSLTPSKNASKPLLESFVSYSIEFSSFPDFAGKPLITHVDWTTNVFRKFDPAEQFLLQPVEQPP